MDVIIVDDEPAARRTLRECCAAEPDLRVVGEFGDGRAALEAIRARPPQLLFLDIQMDTMNGIEVARRLDPATLPSIVFVTAYDQYALQAFETQALDYVLKPVQPERLQKSVQKLQLVLAGRAQSAINQAATDDAGLQATAEQLHRLLATLQPAAAAQPPLQQLPVSPAGAGGSVIRMVPVAEVLFFQAADKYVRVVTASGEHLLRTPLKELLPQLDAQRFWQIHRGTVVRADAIDTVRRDESGRLHLALRGHPERLVVSRLYAQRFKAL